MRIVDPQRFPHRVKEDAQLRIPLADGTWLAGRVWRPETSDTRPVPAVLEFIPYRQRDLTAVRDSIHHPYLAGHGYAGIRVDLRGSGDSEGILTDEYLEQELCDAEQVLAWLAAQPWCNGRTGMMGISWGGFNTLQVAARRPPSLRAVVTACSTDDRYADDVHYMGGCLLTDNLSWASTMFAYNSCPPDPAVVGERWREMWHQRLDGSGLWLEEWLRHQRRDAYWRHGSICEDYSAITCPVLAVSGWADGYTNSVFRLLAALDVPRKGLDRPLVAQVPPPRSTRPRRRLPAGTHPVVGPLVARRSTTTSWPSRCCASGCRRVSRRRRPTRSGRVAGSVSRAGLHRRFGRSPTRSVTTGSIHLVGLNQRRSRSRSSPCSLHCRWASSPANGAPTTLHPTCPTTNARKTAAP